MAYSVLAVTEQRDGTFRKVTYEILSEARRLADALGGDVAAIILGNDIQALAEQLSGYGVNTVFLADDAIFTNYSPEASSKTVAELVKKIAPKAVLFGATTMGKDLAPRVAARLDAGLATDCVALRVENSEIIAEKVIYTLRHQNEKEIICNNARQYCLENFDWQVISRRYAILTNEILQ